MSIRVIDHTILRAFNAVMSMDKSPTNIRRTKAELDGCMVVGKLVHNDNVKHMYDKRIHRGAGEFTMKGVQPVIEASIGEIRGPVVVTIRETAARKSKKAA